MNEKLRELCKAYISEELEERGTSVNASDLDGLVENMSGEYIQDVLSDLAVMVVREYEAETQA